MVEEKHIIQQNGITSNIILRLTLVHSEMSGIIYLFYFNQFQMNLQESASILQQKLVSFQLLVLLFTGIGLEVGTEWNNYNHSLMKMAYSILIDQQSGFRKHYSCETALNFAVSNVNKEELLRPLIVSCYYKNYSVME